MSNAFEQFQQSSKDAAEKAMASFGEVTKTAQALTTELTDYAKKSFEEGSAVVTKLLSAKTLDSAVEIQSAYVKSSYEAFVAQATRLNQFYVDLAKEAAKPFEGLAVPAK